MTSTRNIRTGLRAAFAVAALAAAFVLPTQAMATTDCSNVGSDPTQAQYCSPTQGGGSEGTSSSGTAQSSGTAGVSTSSGSGGSLPFTGLDLAALLAVAGALTAAGFALRRLSGPSKS